MCAKLYESFPFNTRWRIIHRKLRWHKYSSVLLHAHFAGKIFFYSRHSVTFVKVPKPTFMSLKLLENDFRNTVNNLFCVCILYFPSSQISTDSRIHTFAIGRCYALSVYCCTIYNCEVDVIELALDISNKILPVSTKKLTPVEKWFHGYMKTHVKSVVYYLK